MEKYSTDVLGAVGAAARSYETGLVETIPLPLLAPASSEKLKVLSKYCYALQAQPETESETSLNFITPVGARDVLASASVATAANRETSLREETASKFSGLLSELNDLIWDAYGLDESSRRSLSVSFGRGEDQDSEEDAEAETGEVAISRRSICVDLASYALGCAFGRWDIRFATGEKPAPELPDPFAPLPVCPPGQLQNEQGLPITREDVTRLKEEGHWNYPIEIPWDGILVDDPGHPLDLEARVHQVLQIIWQDRWEAIEREACEILGVRTLRDYFRKPADFFADHLKRYSKSRRKAPIYWPLQTQSGSYTLWLYYHRLNDQTLYTCSNTPPPPLMVTMTPFGDIAPRSKGMGILQRDIEVLH
jgi:hypothetical protein